MLRLACLLGLVSSFACASTTAAQRTDDPESQERAKSSCRATCDCAAPPAMVLEPPALVPAQDCAATRLAPSSAAGSGTPQLAYLDLELREAQTGARRGRKTRNWGIALLSMGTLALAVSTATMGLGSDVYVADYRGGYDERWYTGFGLAMTGVALFGAGMIVGIAGGAKRRHSDRRQKEIQALRWQLGLNGPGASFSATF